MRFTVSFHCVDGSGLEPQRFSEGLQKAGDLPGGALFHVIYAPESSNEWGASLQVDATSATEAVVLGDRALRKACSAARMDKPNVLEIEAVPTDDSGEPKRDRLIGLSDIARLMGVSRQRVHQIAYTSGFPAPFQRPLTRAGALWRERDVRRWMQATKRRPVSKKSVAPTSKRTPTTRGLSRS